MLGFVIIATTATVATSSMASSAKTSETSSVSCECAARHEYTVYLRVGGLGVADDGAHLFSEKGGLGTLEVGVGYLPTGFEGQLELAVGLAVAGSSAETFETLEASISIYGLRGAASYHMPLLDTVRLYGRAALLLELATARFESSASTPWLVDQTRALLGTELVLGLDLPILLSGTDLNLAEAILIMMEGGYALRVPAAFDEIDTGVDEDDKPSPIAVRGVDLGGVNLSGWLFRVGIGVRF